MTTVLLVCGTVIGFLAVLVLIRWMCTECATAPLAKAYNRIEASGPAEFWPRCNCPAAQSAETVSPEQASVLFRQGCPCHLALFAAYAPVLGLSRGEIFERELELLGKMDLTHMCGAATGALTLLRAEQELQAKGASRDQKDTQCAFLRSFAEHWGSLYCKDILGCDLETREGQEKARTERLIETLCPDVVKDAATLFVQLSQRLPPARAHRAQQKDVGLDLHEAGLAA